MSEKAGQKVLLVSCGPAVCSYSCVPRPPPAMAGAFQGVSPTGQGFPNFNSAEAQCFISLPAGSFDKRIMHISTHQSPMCVTSVQSGCYHSLQPAHTGCSSL